MPGRNRRAGASTSDSIEASWPLTRHLLAIHIEYIGLLFHPVFVLPGMPTVILVSVSAPEIHGFGEIDAFKMVILFDPVLR